MHFVLLYIKLSIFNCIYTFCFTLHQIVNVIVLTLIFHFICYNYVFLSQMCDCFMVLYCLHSTLLPNYCSLATGVFFYCVNYHFVCIMCYFRLSTFHLNFTIIIFIFYYSSL